MYRALAARFVGLSLKDRSGALELRTNNPGTRVTSLHREPNGLPASDKVVGNYVKSVTVQGGAIHVVFGNEANGALRGKTLSLRPAVVEDAPVVPVAWVCGFAATPEKMTAFGDNRTDLPKNWLPVNCR